MSSPVSEVARPSVELDSGGYGGSRGKNALGLGSFTLDNGDSGGLMQVDCPNYHHENHTAAQACGWTANAPMAVDAFGKRAG